MGYDKEKLKENREKIARVAQEERDRKYKLMLQESIKKKLLTCTIHSLAEIEKHLGHLWGEELAEGAELTESQEKYDAIYEKLRKSILDKGNELIRNMQKEIECYKVTEEKIVFPVLRNDR